MLTDESQILATAVDCFAEHGFSGTSLADLDARLELADGTLEGEYGSLDRLWEIAVLEAFNQHHDVVYNRCAAVFASHARELDRFEQLIAIFIESAADHPELQLVINHEATHESPRVDAIFRLAVEPLIDGFRPMIDSLVTAREIRRLSDREMFFLIANGAASIHAFGPLSARFDEHDGPWDPGAYARSVARLIVDGLRPQERRPSAAPRPLD